MGGIQGAPFLVAEHPGYPLIEIGASEAGANAADIRINGKDFRHSGTELGVASAKPNGKARTDPPASLRCLLPGYRAVALLGRRAAV